MLVSHDVGVILWDHFLIKKKDERYIYIYMVGTQVTKRLVAQWAFLNIPNGDMYTVLNSFTPIIDIKEEKKKFPSLAIDILQWWILGAFSLLGLSPSLCCKSKPKWANALFAQNIHHFAPFPKLIREMPFFCNSIFSKSSFNLKLDFWSIEL